MPELKYNGWNDKKLNENGKVGKLMPGNRWKSANQTLNNLCWHWIENENIVQIKLKKTTENGDF